MLFDLVARVRSIIRSNGGAEQAGEEIEHGDASSWARRRRMVLVGSMVSTLMLAGTGIAASASLFNPCLFSGCGAGTVGSNGPTSWGTPTGPLYNPYPTSPPWTTPNITTPPITWPTYSPPSFVSVPSPILPPPTPRPPVTVKPPVPRPPVTVKPPVPRPPVTVKPPVPRPPVTVKPPVPRPPVTVKPPVPRPPVTVKPPVPRPPVTVKPPVPRPPVEKGPEVGDAPKQPKPPTEEDNDVLTPKKPTPPTTAKAPEKPTPPTNPPKEPKNPQPTTPTPGSDDSVPRPTETAPQPNESVPQAPPAPHLKPSLKESEGLLRSALQRLTESGMTKDTTPVGVSLFHKKLPGSVIRTTGKNGEVTITTAVEFALPGKAKGNGYLAARITMSKETALAWSQGKLKPNQLLRQPNTTVMWDQGGSASASVPVGGAVKVFGSGGTADLRIMRTDSQGETLIFDGNSAKGAAALSVGFKRGQVAAGVKLSAKGDTATLVAKDKQGRPVHLTINTQVVGGNVYAGVGWLTFSSPKLKVIDTSQSDYIFADHRKTEFVSGGKSITVTSKKGDVGLRASAVMQPRSHRACPNGCTVSFYLNDGTLRALATLPENGEPVTNSDVIDRDLITGLQEQPLGKRHEWLTEWGPHSVLDQALTGKVPGVTIAPLKP